MQLNNNYYQWATMLDQKSPDKTGEKDRVLAKKV